MKTFSRTSRCEGVASSAEKQPESGSTKLPLHRKESGRQRHSCGRRSSKLQPRAFFIRTVVLRSTSISPASIRWTLRMFRSANSAICCWVISRAMRSRRILSPSFLSDGERALDFFTHLLSRNQCLTETAFAPKSVTRLSQSGHRQNQPEGSQTMKKKWTIIATTLGIVVAAGPVLCLLGRNLWASQGTPTPLVANYYSAQNPDWPALPFVPFEGLAVYCLSNNAAMYDDLLINYVRLQQEATLVLALESALEGPPVPGEGGGEGPPVESPPAYDYPSNILWIEITGVTNSYAYLTLHGTVADQQYQLLSQTNLNPSADWVPGEIITAPRGQTRQISPLCLWAPRPTCSSARIMRPTPFIFTRDLTRTSRTRSSVPEWDRFRSTPPEMTP